ncbi:hypothetical protein BV20DRAFT_968422 [Pilatotrama ljubarskyi]|nr:hypothetical protein BV20DRAFT_968422 [Pilatotrama ljubarskyi]
MPSELVVKRPDACLPLLSMTETSKSAPLWATICASGLPDRSITDIFARKVVLNDDPKHMSHVSECSEQLQLSLPWTYLGRTLGCTPLECLGLSTLIIDMFNSKFCYSGVFAMLFSLLPYLWFPCPSWASY